MTSEQIKNLKKGDQVWILGRNQGQATFLKSMGLYDTWAYCLKEGNRRPAWYRIDKVEKF